MRNTQPTTYSTADKLLPLDKFLPARKFLLAAVSCGALAVVFCFCHAPALYAQTSATTTNTAATASNIDGRVTDAQGASVAGAIVTLYARGAAQLRLTAVTDANGAYRFERLADGEYLIEADARGFAPAVAERVRVARGRTTTLDFKLEVAGVSAQVVVTAAAAPQPVDEVSKAVTTIDERELEERDEYSIPEALRTVPGLRVQQLGGPGARVSIRTRQFCLTACAFATLRRRRAMPPVI
jgi:hypothetical protein